MHTPTRPLVRKEGLLEHVEVSKRTLDNLMARNAIPFYKVGAVVLFDVAEVLEALKAYKRRAKVPPNVTLKSNLSVTSKKDSKKAGA